MLHLFISHRLFNKFNLVISFCYVKVKSKNYTISERFLFTKEFLEFKKYFTYIFGIYTSRLKKFVYHLGSFDKFIERTNNLFYFTYKVVI